MFYFGKHATWREKLEKEVASKVSELNALKEARENDRRLLSKN